MSITFRLIFSEVVSIKSLFRVYFCHSWTILLVLGCWYFWINIIKGYDYKFDKNLSICFECTVYPVNHKVNFLTVCIFFTNGVFC